MKITKFVHACLLVETKAKTVLFDPGVYSWQSGLVELDSWKKLDYLLITHEHEDHFHLPFIQALVKRWPKLKIITNEAIVELLKSENIAASAKAPAGIARFEAKHEETPFKGVPQNTGFHLQNQLTHPGDSHSFKSTKPILALPIAAPWASMTDALKLAIKLKPKIVVPIHDWHWNPVARETAYEWSYQVLGEHKIEFIKVIDAQPFELEA